jgi:hypothetical protein
VFSSPFCAALKVADQVVEREAEGSGFRDEPIREVAQVFLAVTICFSFDRASAYECTHSSTSFDNSLSLQLGINFRNSVRVNAKIHGHLPDGGQLHTERKFSGGYGKLDSSPELSV